MTMAMMICPIIILLSLPALALEECERVETINSIPCLLVTTWDSPGSCANYNASFYNENGTNIENQTFGDIGMAGRCNVTFRHTDPQQYYINSSLQTFNVTVGVENNLIAIVLMSVVIMGVFYFLARANFAMDKRISSFSSWGMIIIQLILMISMIYAHQAGISYTGLLHFNFIAMLFVLVILGFLTLIFYTIHMADLAKGNDYENRYKKR